MTPAEDEDRDRVAREATEAVDDDIAPERAAGGAPLGAASGSGDPPARDEVDRGDRQKYE